MKNGNERKSLTYQESLVGSGANKWRLFCYGGFVQRRSERRCSTNKAGVKMGVVCQCCDMMVLVSRFGKILDENDNNKE